MDIRELNLLLDKRRAIGPLLSQADPADALTAYYALWHDPRRTRLTLHSASVAGHPAQGRPGPAARVDGFVTVSQTGVDLFRPLVTLRAPGAAAVGELLHAALTAHRPYYFVVPAELASAVRDHVTFSRSSLNRVYRLDPALFQPVVNVLVQRVQGEEGAYRFQIESEGQLAAMSGTNWRSPNFAEVFVYVHPKGRGRGWGRSVVSACTSALLEEKLSPLYMVEEGNEASIHVAESLGYVDSGAREFAGEGELA